MDIRNYRHTDRNALIELWSNVIPDDPPHNAPASVIDAKLAIDDLLFVAENKGRIIGACLAGYDGHRGWLYAVAVASDYRRQGLGRGLVRHALRALAQIGCIKVNLQIRASNEAVAAFYRSVGFEIEDRISMGAFIEQPESNDA